MKIDELITNNQPRINQPLTTPVKWVRFRSNKLNDDFIVISDKKYLKELREKYPNIAIYFKQEIEELWNVWKFGDKSKGDESIKIIHEMKKSFNGWVLLFKGKH